MDLPALLILIYLFATGVTWIVAKLVSAPQRDLVTCFFYAAILGVINVAFMMVTSLLLSGNGMPIAAKPLLLLGVGLVLLLGVFWITRKLFRTSIPKSLALCLVLGFVGFVLFGLLFP